MNLDSLSCALAEISYSVSNLTKKNFKAVVTEISHLVNQHGAEADRHLFRCLFSHIEFGGDGKGSGKDFHQTQFLIQECGNLLNKPDFVSILCNAIDNPFQQQKSLKPSSQLFSNISKVLKLSRVQEVAFGLALIHSTNPGISTQAAQFVKQKVPDLLHSYVDADSTTRQEGGLQDTAVETLHFLLTHLLHGKGQFGVGTEQKEALLKSLRRDFPKDRVPAILSLILYPEIEDIPTNKLFDTAILPASMMVASLEHLIQESGISCTASIEECRSKLMQFGAKKLTPSTVARVLGMMARYPNGVNEQGQVPPQAITGWNDTPGETIWNVEIFVMVVKDLAPHLNWKDVVANLDYPEFMVSNSKGLELLVKALFQGLQAIFPVEYIYKPWNNVEGQLSFINQALRSPNIFSFADYPGDTVVIDILKTTPNEDDRDIKTWKSLDLVETLLRLSDAGHFQQIQDLMKVPIQKCPDILVLALLQTKPSWNTLKQELIAKLMPIFLGSHTNSAVVLHYAWHHQGHSNNIRTLIMHSMAEWYMRGDQHDQMRLSRILDVAQDLKALSMLLNATPFAFVIDLACLASRRGYLKLDKWLSDKISEHKEPFVQACVSFLKRRFPQLMGGPVKEDLAAQMKSQQLLPETVATMLTHLKSWSIHVSQELADAITTMFNNANSLFKARQAQQPPGPSTPGFPTSSPLDVLSGIGGVLGHNPAVSQTSVASAFPQVSSAFQQSTPQIPGMNTATPGSPSKAFPGVTPSSNPAGNPIPSLPSQFQNLNTGGPPGDMSGIFPEMNQQFSKDVEDKANTYFQQIYNQPPHLTMTIDDVLEMLKKFKDSQNKSERDVFACMLRNLFEEYRFFPQYPERELHTTAVLFGGIIEQGIVTYWTLGIALRYILEALRKPHGSKMYYFGIAALDKFKSRLKDYPQYCQHLACIPHFSRFPQHLIEYVEFGARSKEPPHMPQAPCSLSQSMAGLSIPGASLVNMPPKTSGTPQEGWPDISGSAPKMTPTVSAPTPSTPTSASEIAKPTFQKPSIATATNIDTLLAGQQKDEVAVPTEAIQDKVFFIFNNLSQSNMAQKGEELKEQIGTEFIPWCSQYLVMKRASIEPNFHTLYSSFVDVLAIPELTDLIIKETFRNIKVLLRSDKGVANFSDRTLLKNLGHWLGMLTLAKNKPILQVEIDIKSLIYEAYQKGAQELLYVVPFSAKVLESCARSKVFKAPNPWTLGIMNVLAELHMEPDLKLNLKFEIEVLCKTLNIDINDLKPTNYLKDPMRIATIEPQLSAPRPVDPVTTPTPQPFAGAPNSLMNTVLPPMIPMQTTATTTSSMTATTPSLPPQPQYSFNEINTHSLSGLAQHIIINDQIALFHTNPNLKQFVRPALEKAVQELLPPVVERSIKIALTTCEQTVKKDFALDPEEGRMRSAAHSMVRNITAGMALITCREPLFINISNNLKTAFLSTLRDVKGPQLSVIEDAVQTLAQDNTELVCAFIQKTAVDRAIPEMDKRLASEFDLRKHARSENRRYCDPVVLTYQAERMPEQIRLRVGGVTPQQIAVYEEFARNIPGFLPMTDNTTFPPGVTKPVPSFAQTQDDIMMIYEKIIREIEGHLQHMISLPTTNPMITQLNSLMDSIILARQSREVSSAEALLQKAVEGLLDQYTMASATDQEIFFRYRECHLLVLRGLQDPRAYGTQWASKEVTNCLVNCREEYRYNIDAVDLLIRSQLVNLQQYDLFLAALIKKLRVNEPLTNVQFAMQIIQRYFLDEKSPAPDADFNNTIEALTLLAIKSKQPPEGLPALIELVRQKNEQKADTLGLLDRSNSTAYTVMMQSGICQAKEFDDPPGLHEKTEYLLMDWVNMYHSPQAGRDRTKAFFSFVQNMHQQGILKTDDLISRFFRLCTEMCVDLCYRALLEQNLSPVLIRGKCFQTLDAFVRLIALLVKHSGDTDSASTVTKIYLLNKILGIITGVLIQDHEVRGTEFQQLPYHRLFIMLFIELNAPEPILESINMQVLVAFCNVFMVLRPAKAPGFAYAWLELISHRVFIGRLLALTPQQRGWGMYAQLLINLFRFLSPFLRNAELQKPTHLLYKGTLRVLLVLLHDFPEFLCDYHCAFCDVVPPNCIQMRNLILSAFPRKMRLPDPFTANLKVDSLPDITQQPRILPNYVQMIQPASFKKDLDSYLKTRAPITFLSELRSSLQQNTEPGCHYNIPLINALVLYVGTQAILFIQGKGQSTSMGTIAPSSHVDIFQYLAVNLDTEGRYLFLTAIANQLRYPNSHTHYFSCTMLYLFAQANNEQIPEQITRVLLERLIVNRPHPWGLLITFIEMIKNPTYKFWNHEFVHCAPELDKMLESVARSCIHPQKPAQTMREPENQSEVH